jgi:predicted transcriptional regulator
MSNGASRARAVPIAAEVVAAYLRGNRLPVSQLPDLIEQVHVALSGLDDDPAKELRPEPFVSIRRSVGANYLVCLDCGRKLRTLKRHVRTTHRLSLKEYREKWNLPWTYPTTAANYSQQRSSLAKKFGLGKPRFKRNGKKDGRAR